MNNYITLDGYRYATNANSWRPIYDKPHTERRTLTGQVDITYGPSVLRSWEGEINAPVTARASGWGTITTLRTTLEKKQSVVFTDHDGNSNTIHCLGPFEERSLMNMWDSASNVFYVTVKLVVS